MQRTQFMKQLNANIMWLSVPTYQDVLVFLLHLPLCPIWCKCTTTTSSAQSPDAPPQCIPASKLSRSQVLVASCRWGGKRWPAWHNPPFQRPLPAKDFLVTFWAWSMSRRATTTCPGFLGIFWALSMKAPPRSDEDLHPSALQRPAHQAGQSEPAGD